MVKRSIIIPNWLLCLFVTLPLLAGMLLGFAPLRSLDLMTYDLLSKIREHDAQSPVVVIGIDQKSIDKIGPWPWPRRHIAKIIREVSNNGAKAVGLNILYPEREDNTALKEISEVRKLVADDPGLGETGTRIKELLNQATDKLNNDAKLLGSVRPTKNIVLPIIFDRIDRNGDSSEVPGWLKKNTLEAKAVDFDPRQLLADLKNPVIAIQSEPPPTKIRTTFHELAAVAGRHGHINHIQDFDNTVRRERLLIQYQDQLVPSLSLQMAMAYNDHGFSELQISRQREVPKAISYSGKRFSVSPYFEMYIDMHINPFVVSHYSASDLLEGKFPKGSFEDKAVMIGITDPDLTKMYKTPIGKELSGVEINAYTTENLLNNSFIHRPAWAWFLESIILLYFGIVLLAISDRLETKISILIFTSFLFSWCGLAVFMFLNDGIWFYTAPHITVVFGGLALQQFNKHLAAPGKKIDEHTEMNKMLGLSFQAQGLLDMAFDSFRKCSLNDSSVKGAVYNLALDFERKRMFNKAIAVYEYLLKGGKHKDAHERIWRLRRVEAKSLGSSLGERKEKAVLLDQDDSQIKPTLGRYEVIKEIGKGAIGTVYLGRDPKINRKVAIKTLRYDDIDSDQLAEIKDRFFREAEAAGRLSHPNIVTIYDAGEDYDVTYMAMEYLDGHDLSRHCKKEKVLPFKVILNIIIRVAFALDYAHKHKVVHRDIKPANIMLTEKGHVKVTDFGIARLAHADSTQTGVILGTPNYMSPEQVLGKKIDGRSDIFSLGAVFYELLTGEKPFRSSNIGNLMHNIASVKYTPANELRPDAPPCCELLVRRMMTKSRSKRYSNAGQVVIEAQQCLEKI